MRAVHLVLSCSFLLAACGGAHAGSAAPTSAAASPAVAKSTTLRGEDGDVALAELVKRAPYTVLLFFSHECPVQKAHDARLRELASAYAPRGVAFVAVSSEDGVDVAKVRDEVKKRALPMPLLVDPGAALADALGVEYSTHVVLLDGERRVLYSGAIDSERTRTTTHPTTHLRDALDAVLAGKPVEKPRVEPLGCPLLKHG